MDVGPGKQLSPVVNSCLSTPPLDVLRVLCRALPDVKKAEPILQIRWNANYFRTQLNCTVFHILPILT